MSFHRQRCCFVAMIPTADRTQQRQQDLTEPGTGHDQVTRTNQVTDVEPGGLIPTIWAQPLPRATTETEVLPLTTEVLPTVISTVGEPTPPYCSLLTDSRDQLPSSSKADGVVGDQGCQTDWSLLPQKGEGDMVWELLQALDRARDTIERGSMEREGLYTGDCVQENDGQTSTEAEERDASSESHDDKTDNSYTDNVNSTNKL